MPEGNSNTTPRFIAPEPILPNTERRARKSNKIDPISWLMVSGAPRSGTTILTRLINAHPKVAIFGEYGLGNLFSSITQIVKRHDNGDQSRPSLECTFSDRDLNKFPSTLDKYRQHYKNQKRSLESIPTQKYVIRPRSVHFNTVAAGIYSAMFEKRAPPTSVQASPVCVIGDKMPITRNWEDIDYITEIAPDLKLIFIIRRPSNVIHSSLVRRELTLSGHDNWPVSTVEQAAEEWCYAWERMRALQNDDPEKVYVLKYEDLTASVDEEMNKLFSFLNLNAIRFDPNLVTHLPEELQGALFTTDEKVYISDHFDEFESDWRSIDANTLLQTKQSPAAPYKLDTLVELGDKLSGRYLVEGFSHAEGWGRWTDRATARIRLRHRPVDDHILLEFDVKAIRPGATACNVVIRVNGGKRELLTVDGSRSHYAVLLHPEASHGLTETEIELRILNSSDPDRDHPGDPRRLGLGIASLRLCKL